MSPSRILSLVLAAALLPTPAHAQPATGDLAENLARYQRIADDLSVTVAQTGVIQRQLQDLEQQIEVRRASVGRVAAAAYRGHRVHSLYALTGASSRDDTVRRLRLVRGFAERQQQEIDALALTQARYQTAQRTLESLIAQQRSQKQALAALHTKLQRP